MKVFSPFLNGNTTTSGSLTLPRHPISSSITNPNTGSIYHDTTDNVVKVYTGNAWETVGAQTAPAGPASTDIDYLVVAGGGAGGGDVGTGYSGGGGGGAGGLLSSSLSSVISGSSFTVTVGGGSSEQTQGTDSSIAGSTITTITATGGGFGGKFTGYGAGDGGSGGGAPGWDSNYANAGGSGTVGQGNNGGRSYAGTSDGGAGGGGAGQAGSDVESTTTDNGALGGNGLQSNITGTPTYYAGGGGGGGYYSGAGAAGGSGGGGTGAGGRNNAGSPTAGTVNTGGGGGGAAEGNTTVRNGGSGVAIFAYDSASFNCAGGIVGDAGNRRKYHQLNESGTFKVGSTSDFSVVSSNLLLHFDAGNFSSRGISTCTDLSGNGNNGTVSSATLDGYSYSFNGSSYITAPPTSFVSSAHTIETWLYKGDINSSYDCIYAAGAEFQTYWRSDFIEFYNDSGNGGAYEVNGLQLTGLSATTWYHYTLTDNGSGTIKMYLNGGAQTNTTTYSGNTGVDSGTPRIGDYPPNSLSYPFVGNIAQFRIYTKALSDAEVSQNYNATKTNFT